MSNVQVFPNVFPTLMPLQQENLLKLQQQILHGISRSSRPQVFCRKALLKVTHNSQINACLIKLQTGGASKQLQHRCFPVKFAKILRTPILNNICEQQSHVEQTLMYLHFLAFKKRQEYNIVYIYRNKVKFKNNQYDSH